MKKLILLLALCLSLSACKEKISPNSDQKEHRAQEEMLSEAVAQVGMPAIKNFREKKLMKDIIEKRDHEGFMTYTYLKNEMNNQLTLLCESVGYPIPYATQFTNPQRVASYRETPSTGNVTLPQADPNGLFSPASADGTWVMCKDPNSSKVSPVYVEPKVITSPFRLKQ